MVERDQGFESGSLQRRVCELSVPRRGSGYLQSGSLQGDGARTMRRWRRGRDRGGDCVRIPREVARESAMMSPAIERTRLRERGVSLA